jgi:uncharacterized protein YdeI (YjbR/CyaY-like superfamily)
MVRPVFFATAAALRAWLEANHATVPELWIGLHSAASGREARLTYKQALDEALCFGWIDGVRKSVDPTRYMQRFTPRRPKSYWSRVNTARAKELVAAGRMAPSGLKAFEARDEPTTRRYSFEREAACFTPSMEKTFRANAPAWEFFQSEPPGYQRLCTFWVTSAKKEETRERRLAELIARCARRLALSQLVRPTPKSGPARSGPARSSAPSARRRGAPRGRR